VKAFFVRYSYSMMKLFLNQVAIALFGLGLAMACGMAGNHTMQVVTGVGSVLFYLFLQYANMWELGAKDGISAKARGESRGLWRGFAMGAVAGGINILLALLIVLGALVKPLAGLGGVAKVIALIVEGMYIGILTVPLGGLPLNTYVLPYVLIVLPSILVCGAAYIIGSYDLHFTNILIQKRPDVKNNGRPEQK